MGDSRDFGSKYTIILKGFTETASNNGLSLLLCREPEQTCFWAWIFILRKAKHSCDIIMIEPWEKLFRWLNKMYSWGFVYLKTVKRKLPVASVVRNQKKLTYKSWHAWLLMLILWSISRLSESQVKSLKLVIHEFLSVSRIYQALFNTRNRCQFWIFNWHNRLRSENPAGFSIILFR